MDHGSTDIISTGSKPQLLSHCSALFVNQLVYSSPLVDLNLGKIQFEDRHNWGTIIKAIDYSQLMTFGVAEGAVCIPSLASDMWGFLVAQTVVACSL